MARGSTSTIDRLNDALPWVALAVIAVIILLWLVLTSRHPGFATHDAAFCKSSYAKARTLQDTLMVDAQQSLEKSPGALSCGNTQSLRRASMIPLSRAW